MRLTIADTASKVAFSTSLATPTIRRLAYETTVCKLGNDVHADIDYFGHKGGACLKRVDVKGLSPLQIREQVDFSTPCILTGALKLGTCETWCDTLLEGLGDSEVDYQIRRNDNGRSELFRSTLADFIHDLEESNHDQSWYLLEENLLDNPRVRPALEPPLRELQRLLGWDEFDLFPCAVRPQKSCLIVGGLGARSFLHGDPMEWIGWNVLLEGRKLWTFLPPSPELDAPLGTYRLAPNAFGAHNISAGWQSDLDLYRRGKHTARGRESVSWSPSAPEAQDLMGLATGGVQGPGDVVIIPPRHWHQVYHLEPSVAVASQYMDHNVRRGVFRHILDWCGAAEGALPAEFDKLTPAQQVQHVLKAAFVAQLGQKKGLEALATLEPP